jgi:hypothetical protein
MEWRLLRDQADLDELYRTFNGFHDTCLRECHFWYDSFVDRDGSLHHGFAGRLHVRLLIQRQAASGDSGRPAAIELWFEEATRVQATEIPVDYQAWLTDATLLKRDGIFYWAAAADWTPDDPDLPHWDTSSGVAAGPITWVGGRTLRWRDANDWMGDRLRYAAGPP